MAKLTDYTCVECGKQFQATQPAKYCSGACKVKHINRQRAQFQCVYCGKVFEGAKNQKPKFCSQKCVSACIQEVLANPDSPLAKYINIKREKHFSTRVCILCGKSFETQNPSNVNRHCPECQAAYDRQYGKDWRAGRVDNKYRVSEAELDMALAASGIDASSVQELQGETPWASRRQSPHPLNQTREETNARRRRVYAKRRALGLEPPSAGPKAVLRHRMLEQAGYRCEACGFDADEDALQVHHKDMDRRHNTDDNLIVLCANCHAIFHQRVKRDWYSLGDDKVQAIVAALDSFITEVKHRNEAGTPDRVTRTEGLEESRSGATRSGTVRTAMNHQEAGAHMSAPDLFDMFGLADTM